MKFRAWPPFSARSLVRIWKRDAAAELARRGEAIERDARACHRCSVRLLGEAEQLQADAGEALRGRRSA